MAITLNAVQSVPMPTGMMPGGAVWRGPRDAFAFDPAQNFAYALTWYSQSAKRTTLLTKIDLSAYTAVSSIAVPATPDAGTGTIIEIATNVIADSDGFVYVVTILNTGTAGTPYKYRIHKLQSSDLSEVAVSAYTPLVRSSATNHVRLSDAGGGKYIALAYNDDDLTTPTSAMLVLHRSDLSVVVSVADATGGDASMLPWSVNRFGVDPRNGDLWYGGTGGGSNGQDLVKMALPSGTITAHKNVWPDALDGFSVSQTVADAMFITADGKAIIGDENRIWRKVDLDTLTTVATLAGDADYPHTLYNDFFDGLGNAKNQAGIGNCGPVFKTLGTFDNTPVLIRLKPDLSGVEDITALFEPNPPNPLLDVTADNDVDVIWDDARNVLWALEPFSDPAFNNQATRWEAFVMAGADCSSVPQPPGGFGDQVTEVMGFTDHDQDILYMGVLYRARTGSTFSAIDNKSDLSASNNDIESFLESDAITEPDLRGGLYDGAEIEQMIVNWADTSMGHLTLRKGVLGTVKMVNGLLTAEVRGLESFLETTIGDSYGPLCRAEFGSTPTNLPGQHYYCYKNVDNFRQSGTVASSTPNTVTPNAGLLMRGDPATPTADAPDGWFNEGLIIFTSGANNNQKYEIKSYAGGVLTLFLPLLAACAPGDTFLIEKGCNKTPQACIYFENMANFRGEPFMPSLDLLLDTNQGGVG